MAYVTICPLCGKELRIDDIDFSFRGNQDEYSICDHCHTSFIFYIRYGSVWKYGKTKMIYSEKWKDWLSSNDPKDHETVYVFKGRG